MREKELRLALVCFGGISLAVYMHGISKEILKLVRASSALHAIIDRNLRVVAAFPDNVPTDESEHDTESVYFELLRDIGRTIELRVIVDIIAGASAGGINGTMLARALAHDLPIGRLRDLWLDKADVTELLAHEARAKAWSKWFLRPLIEGFARTGLIEPVKDPEVRDKLSLFVRSRWFKPPLDGMRMAELMYDAIASMEAPRRPGASLIPTGQKLDLFVTLTDFHGYQQLIQLHDPPIIREHEHRHILRFSYRRWPSGDIETDFDLGNAAALAFAARATSSFPGAFPPAQVIELDRLLQRKGAEWPSRSGFLAENFRDYTRVGLDPQIACFIDGSVLNNKPFREAIQAIKGRPAYRQVDRRLVYIDPDPTQAHLTTNGQIPGFFTALKGALSDLPRNEPISDELDWVNGFNERVRRLRGIVEAARPQIGQLVAEIVALSPEQPYSIEQIRTWREMANARVARDAGFAYEGYVRLKLTSVRDFVARLIAKLCDLPPGSLAARAIGEVIEVWTALRGVTYDRLDDQALRLETAATPTELPRWARFLLAFDLDYRKRRLQFLIQGQNRLYQMLGATGEGALRAASLDRLKRDFYRCLDALRHREQADHFSLELRALARRMIEATPSAEAAPRLADHARSFAARQVELIDNLIDGLATEVDLDGTTHDVDALLTTMDPKDWAPTAQREVLINYLGFPFWDVLTFSVTSWRDVGEFNEILVDRISPEDARSLAQPAPLGLKGTSFGHFGAFLSRAYRENDYLLGRIHAADRLIDLVCNAAALDPARAGIDVLALKRRAFELILKAEAPHLPNSAGLIAELRQRIDRMGRNRS